MEKICRGLKTCFMVLWFLFGGIVHRVHDEIRCFFNTFTIAWLVLGSEGSCYAMSHHIVSEHDTILKIKHDS